MHHLLSFPLPSSPPLYLPTLPSLNPLLSLAFSNSSDSSSDLSILRGSIFSATVQTLKYQLVANVHNCRTLALPLYLDHPSFSIKCQLISLFFSCFQSLESLDLLRFHYFPSLGQGLRKFNNNLIPSSKFLISLTLCCFLLSTPGPW